MQFLSGQSLGRYHILEPLGEGGMAVVYKAYDTRLECEVAVKVIRADQLAPAVLERALKRFEREAKSVARLTHPNIIKVTDFGEHAGSPYLVMPYLPGGTLKQYLKENGLLDWKRAAKLLLPIAEALGYAHERGLIHRDVKPSNILLTDNNTPMLTDFGVAKVLDEEVTQDLTGTSATVGTPEYMAPEQVVSKTVDHRADIYALGVVFYEMVTGRRPYEADTPMAVLFKHASAPLPRATDIVPDLPIDVERLLIKALAKQPEDRYQDMGAFVAALEGLDRQGLGPAPVAGDLQPRSARVAVDQYATVDQFTENVAPEKSPQNTAETFPKARLQVPPVLPKQKRHGKTPLLIGGIALAALLIIGIASGWFTQRSARPATGLPVSTETEASKMISTAPTVTTMPVTATSVLPTITLFIPTATNLPPTPTSRPPTATSVPPTPTEAYTIGSSMISPKDGMKMMYVPAGEFIMGSNIINFNSQQTIKLDAYWIDKTEVTIEMYKKCVDSGVCDYSGLHDNSESWFEDIYVNSYFVNYPMGDVTWFEAKEYCDWAGRRLPTEEEWEKAARGPDGYWYPWGGDFSCEFGNFNDENVIALFNLDGPNCDGFEYSSPVGSFPNGASPYGVFDMEGNVREWVNDWYDDNNSYVVVKGSSYLYHQFNYGSAIREDLRPEFNSPATGFRCVMDAGG